MTDNRTGRGDGNYSPLSAETNMPQNDLDTTNISSLSTTEVEFSARMIYNKMDLLIQQQGKIISLIQENTPKKKEIMMSQNDSDTTNISSSSKEVKFSACLIQQLEKIISLIEAIAHKKEESDNDDCEARGSEEEAYSTEEEPLSDDERLRRIKLYRAARNDDWELARRIYNENGQDFGVVISKAGDTALHIAVAVKSSGFVKKLVEKMSEDHLNKKNRYGRTALFVAAASGTVEIAKVMINRYEGTAMVPDNFGILPIQMAAELGHEDMVEYLYRKTKDLLKDEDRIELLISSIEMDLFGVACRMLNNHKDLAIARAKNGETALHALARKDHALVRKDLALARKDLGLSSEAELDLYALSYSNVLGFGDFKKKWRQRQAHILVEFICHRVGKLSPAEISELIANPRELIFDAAKRGNSLLLSVLIDEYPDLIWEVDNSINNYSIFHYAVMYRQNDVFELIHAIGSSTEILFRRKDKDDNNILHLASMLAPLDRLNIAPGPMNQMQGELMWFQKVKNVVHPKDAKARNKDRRTPRELFTETHKDLRDKAETWMTNTVGSSMVVAALIATVAFAAAITVPGGNNQNTGFPIFLEKVSFIIFALSDAASLIFSSGSIVILLFIPTSSYTEENFVDKLPMMLSGGLNALFMSMAALMIVFSSTFFILFKETRLWIAILVTVYASLPVGWFLASYYHLIEQFLLNNVQPIWDSYLSERWQIRKKLSGCLGTCSTNV